mgnify:CR=1 FL=1|jgi:hypothetical protein
MSNGQALLVLGMSGTGKTSSIEKLKPSETLILMSQFKPLPFAGWSKNYSIDKMEKGKGCILVCDNFDKLNKTLEVIFSKNLPYKNIIVDDFQFYTQRDVFSRADEKGFDKWIDLAKNISDVLMKIIGGAYSKKLNLVIMWHSNTETVAEEKGTMVKTSSKFIDEKMTIEGLFTTVLLTNVQDGEYRFQTNSTGGISSIKSPKGVFELYIPNDLDYVLKRLDKYDKGEL